MMTGNDKPREEAASWYLKLAVHDASESDRERHSAWLAADWRNEQAWREICVADHRMEQVASHPEIANMVREARSMPPLTPQSVANDTDDSAKDDSAKSSTARPRAAGWRYGIAAAIALSIGLGGVMAWSDRTGPDERAETLAAAPRYATDIGESRVLTLADGSTVTLDTNSAIEVPEWGQRRLVKLVKGRAFFDVAPDASHPFVVTNQGRSVKALGTAFSVRESGSAFGVALLEGRVAIDLGMADRQDTVLNVGDTFALSNNVATIRKGAAATSASWLDGRLIFEQRPLGFVVHEMNRYSKRKIVLADPALQNRPFSGTFKLGASEALIQALDAYGVAHIVRQNDSEVVLGAL